jgi:hypothetical protein
MAVCVCGLAEKRVEAQSKLQKAKDANTNNLEENGSEGGTFLTTD